jgi:hypothetical protein
MKYSTPAKLTFIGTNRWGLRLQVADVRLLCDELSLLPSLYKLEWHKWQGPDSYVYREKFDLIIDAVAKLRSVQEIHVPYIAFDGPLALSSLPQTFIGISIRLGTHLAVITGWLEKQQEHLQELHIVRVFLTIDLKN